MLFLLYRFEIEKKLRLAKKQEMKKKRDQEKKKEEKMDAKERSKERKKTVEENRGKVDKKAAAMNLLKARREEKRERGKLLRLNSHLCSTIIMVHQSKYVENMH